MRTGVVLLGVVVLAAGATAVAVATGHWPWAKQQLDAAASAWSAASLSSVSTRALGDAGPVDAAADVAVKVQAGPLSSAQLSAPLYHVTFLAECGAPADMKVTVKVTVKMGRATDAHATADPRNPVVEGCIERAIQDLRWDPSRKSSTVTVHY
jgi:hypothetical protein